MTKQEHRTARTGLGILWPFKSQLEREKAGLGLLGEVPGFRIVAYWPESLTVHLDHGAFVDIWSANAVATKLSTLHDVDDDSSIKHLRGAVWIKSWPTADGWNNAMALSLKHFVDRGAALAWCEPEAGILMYDPTTTFAGCYAAYTKTTGLIWLGGLDDPLRYLGEDPTLAQRIHAAVTAGL